MILLRVVGENLIIKLNGRLLGCDFVNFDKKWNLKFAKVFRGAKAESCFRAEHYPKT